MLAVLMNLGFAGGGTAVAASTNAGSISAFDRYSIQHKRRLAIQQGILKDDEEVLALLIGQFIRRK